MAAARSHRREGQSGLRPSILIAGDSERNVERWRNAADGWSGHIFAIANIAEAAASLSERIAIDTVLVDVSTDPGDAFDVLLEQISYGDANGLFTSIVAVPMELLDRTDAALVGTAVQLLCAPSDADRLAALGLALARPAMQLQDIGREDRASDLRRLSEEVARIAKALAELDGSQGGSGSNGGQGGNKLGDAPLAYRAPPSRVSAPDEIRTIIRLRRLRDRFFNPELFADPAWDMLLDLMAARYENRSVAVSSLCIAAAVPPTTALRWIRNMTELGLFERRADPRDGRRIFIELSDKAVAAMENWLTTASEIGDLPIT